MIGISGIYCIQNLVNDTKYIGKAVDIDVRWRNEINELRRNAFHNIHLQRAWNKYGENNFKFEIVEECNIESLSDRERFWISFFDSYHNGYNQTEGGEGMVGFKHSDETKQKISNKLKETFSNPENTPWYGKHRSDETKAKISKASKERWTDEFRAYMSSINTGRIPSEETKLKMSESQKKIWTDERRAEFSEKFSGEGNPMYGVRFFGEDNPNYGNHKLAGANNPRCRSIYCPELDEVFWGATEAYEKYGFSRTGITECCNGNQKTCGKHPVTGERLRWVYDDERYKLQEFVDNRVRAVYCIELNEYFYSASEASRKYNIKVSNITECCLGHRKSAGKHPITGEKLHWVYTDEMDSSSVA